MDRDPTSQQRGEGEGEGKGTLVVAVGALPMSLGQPLCYYQLSKESSHNSAECLSLVMKTNSKYEGDHLSEAALQSVVGKSRVLSNPGGHT